MKLTASPSRHPWNTPLQGRDKRRKTAQGHHVRFGSPDLGYEDRGCIFPRDRIIERSEVHVVSGSFHDWGQTGIALTVLHSSSQIGISFLVDYEDL